MQKARHTPPAPALPLTPFQKSAYSVCKKRSASHPTPLIPYPVLIRRLPCAQEACHTSTDPALPLPPPNETPIASAYYVSRTCAPYLFVQEEPLTDLEKAFAEAKKRSQAQDGPAKIAAAAAKAAPKPKVEKKPEAAATASKV